MVKPACMLPNSTTYSMVSKLYCTPIIMTRDSISGGYTSHATRRELHHDRMLWLSIETIYTYINRLYMLYRLFMASFPAELITGI